jgi:hypothetical protein
VGAKKYCQDKARRRSHKVYLRSCFEFTITSIIIIGKTAIFKQLCSLENSDKLHPLSTSLDFAMAIVLQNKAISLAPNPQPAGLGPYISVPQQQGGLVYSQAPGSIFVAFYDSKGYDGGILTRLHTEACF